MFSPKKSARMASAASSELAETMRQSKELLDVAGRQAENMLGQIEVLTEGVEKDIRTRILAAVEQISTETRHSLDTIVEHQKQLLAKLDTAFREQSEVHLDQLSKHTETLFTQTRQALEERARTRELQLDEALKKFFVSEKERLQQNLIEKLPAIISEAAEKAIPISEHESLVKDALEKAAKEISWQHPSHEV